MKNGLQFLKQNGTKEKVSMEISNNGVMKVRPKQSFSDTCCSMKKKARGMLFQLLGYLNVVSTFYAARGIDSWEKKAEVV